jgi:hypothetical protein
MSSRPWSPATPPPGARSATLVASCPRRQPAAHCIFLEFGNRSNMTRRSRRYASLRRPRRTVNSHRPGRFLESTAPVSPAPRLERSLRPTSLDRGVLPWPSGSRPAAHGSTIAVAHRSGRSGLAAGDGLLQPGSNGCAPGPPAPRPAQVNAHYAATKQRRLNAISVGRTRYGHTTSVRVRTGSPLCKPAFLQVASNRQGQSWAFSPGPRCPRRMRAVAANARCVRRCEKTIANRLPRADAPILAAQVGRATRGFAASRRG